MHKLSSGLVLPIHIISQESLYSYSHYSGDTCYPFTQSGALTFSVWFFHDNWKPLSLKMSSGAMCPYALKSILNETNRQLMFRDISTHMRNEDKYQLLKYEHSSNFLYTGQEWRKAWSMRQSTLIHDPQSCVLVHDCLGAHSIFSWSGRL